MTITDEELDKWKDECDGGVFQTVRPEVGAKFLARLIAEVRALRERDKDWSQVVQDHAKALGGMRTTIEEQRQEIERLKQENVNLTSERNRLEFKSVQRAWPC